MNLVQKIIAEHLVAGTPAPGNVIELRVDQTLTQDATGTMAYLELEAMKIAAVRTELSVSYVDHNMAQQGPNNMNDHLYLQTVAARYGVHFSRAGNGICHQVHLERFGAPGKTMLGSDSHTPTCGGIGMLAIGAGGLNVALAMAGQPFSLQYPRVIGVRLSGALPPWVAAKDIILKLLALLTTKGNVNCIIEYCGAGVATLSVPQRATITNMGAELGVTTSIFPSDERTRAYLHAQQRGQAWRACAADADATYDRVIEIDLTTLEPLCAQSPSPDNIKPIRALAGTKVQQVCIGSCTNSSVRDLTLAAEVLKGRTVHPSVSLLVTPGSRQVMQMIAQNGVLATFIGAGARILESACGPCIGQGAAPAENTVSMRTFNRNFEGRSGTKNDTVILASPEVAAVAAIFGEVRDPRACGLPYPAVGDPPAFAIDDSLIIPPPPPAERAVIEIRRASTIGPPPCNEPLPAALRGTVVIKVGDKITTDHIMPAGPFLKLRSNIPEYAKAVFFCFNEQGKPSFADRALALKAAGTHGMIVAGASYGQGSSREHAAICPMFLGIKAVIAKSFERIHHENLVNFGVLPLTFTNPADYDAMAQDEPLVIADVRGQLQRGGPVTATLASGATVQLAHALTPKDVTMLLAGGLLNTL
jgi:aconitate hydratase